MDNPLVQPDPGLFIWTILTFLVLLALLGKFAWRPLLAALETRESTIRKSLDDAEQTRQELARGQQESRQIRLQARAEAQSIVDRSRSDAEHLRAGVKQKAQAEADAILRNAERQIQLETAKALVQVRHEVVDLSLLVASRLIKKNLSKEDNEALIEEALSQIESSRA